MNKWRRRAAVYKTLNKSSSEDLKDIQGVLANMIQRRDEHEKNNLQRYERLKKELKLAREFFKSLDPQTLQGVEKAFLATKDAREKLSEVFSPGKTYLICHQCRGRCCNCFWGSSSDLAYFALSGQKLPRLKRHSNPYRLRPYEPYHYCIFLGRNGCALGENKPFTCLRYTCEKITPDIKKRSINEENVLKKARENFIKTLESVGFPQAMGWQGIHWFI